METYIYISQIQLSAIFFFWFSIVCDWCFPISQMFINFIYCNVSNRFLPMICNPDGFPTKGHFSTFVFAASSQRCPGFACCVLACSPSQWLAGCWNVSSLSSAHWWDIIYVDSTLCKLPSVSFAFSNPSSPSFAAFGWTGRSSGIGLEQSLSINSKDLIWN